MQKRFAGNVALELGAEQIDQVVYRKAVIGVSCDVRREDQAVGVPNRIVRRGRFRIDDVQRCAVEPPCLSLRFIRVWSY